jgi:hypothetical protein
MRNIIKELSKHKYWYENWKNGDHAGFIASNHTINYVDKRIELMIYYNCEEKEYITERNIINIHFEQLTEDRVKELVFIPFNDDLLYNPFLYVYAELFDSTFLKAISIYKQSI